MFPLLPAGTGVVFSLYHDLRHRLMVRVASYRPQRGETHGRNSVGAALGCSESRGYPRTDFPLGKTRLRCWQRQERKKLIVWVFSLLQKGEAGRCEISRAHRDCSALPRRETLAGDRQTPPGSSTGHVCVFQGKQRCFVQCEIVISQNRTEQPTLRGRHRRSSRGRAGFPAPEAALTVQAPFGRKILR